VVQRRHAVARFVATRRSRAGITLRLEAAKGSGDSGAAPATPKPTLLPVPSELDCPAVYRQFTELYGDVVFNPAKCSKRLDEFEEMASA
jgi:hypothetical protein